MMQKETENDSVILYFTNTLTQRIIEATNDVLEHILEGQTIVQKHSSSTCRNHCRKQGISICKGDGKETSIKNNPFTCS